MPNKESSVHHNAIPLESGHNGVVVFASSWHVLVYSLLKDKTKTSTLLFSYNRLFYYAK